MNSQAIILTVLHCVSSKRWWSGGLLKTKEEKTPVHCLTACVSCAIRPFQLLRSCITFCPLLWFGRNTFREGVWRNRQNAATEVERCLRRGRRAVKSEGEYAPVSLADIQRSLKDLRPLVVSRLLGPRCTGWQPHSCLANWLIDLTALGGVRGEDIRRSDL